MIVANEWYKENNIAEVFVPVISFSFVETIVEVALNDSWSVTSAMPFQSREKSRFEPLTQKVFFGSCLIYVEEIIL